MGNGSMSSSFLRNARDHEVGSSPVGAEIFGGSGVSSCSGWDTGDREGSSPQTSSFGEGGDVEGMVGEEGDIFLQEAVKIKSGSSSLGNFARKLVQAIFQPGELENRNCSGTRGKKLLDQTKLGAVKKYVFKLYPCVEAQEDAQWRKCVIAIDEFLRRGNKGKVTGNARQQ